MKKTFIITLLWLIAQAGVSQSLPDSMKLKVDNLFKKWDNANTPGAVVGIIRNDSLIYSKGYGLANLEDSTRNTPQSIYYMCSLSKQFTGYAIVLLARQGKLKLDDNIRLYLPWMADFGHKVTIQNLLNQTSGMRDEGDLAEIAGLPAGGILTQEFALSMLKKQRTLNFVPGEKYSYSNSNYILLAEIVKVVSGQSFPDFVANAIFKPLEMTNSRFIADNTDLIKGRAASYSQEKGQIFKNDRQNTYVLGAGGLFTNVDDMARWVMNFYLPRAGDAKVVAQLTTRGKLNGGYEINYALGINVDTSRGWKRLSHNGGLAGYCTVIYVYPDAKTGFLVFGNCGDDDVYSKADQLSALFIPDISNRKAVQPVVQKDSSSALLINPDSFMALAGDYLADNGNQRRFSIVNGRLWMNKTRLMVPGPGDTFSMFDNPEMKFRFHVGADSGVSVDLTQPGLATPIQFTKLVRGLILPDNELEAYTGNYYCPEMDCNYHIILKDHQLWFANIMHRDAKITLMGKDDLLCNDYDAFFYHSKILRADGGKITGFELNSGQTMHLRFNRTE